MRVEVDARSLARSRFAVSPLHELDGLVRCLRGLNASYLPPAWSASMRPRLERLRVISEVEAVLALQTRHGGAQFVLPPPRGSTACIEDDLEAVAATATSIVRRDVAECLARQPPLPQRVRAVLSAEDAAPRIATALRQMWDELLAERWPAVLAVCQRDIAWRVQRLGRGGWDFAFQDLHQRLRWADGGLDVDDGDQRTVVAKEEGLTLIPSAFIAPALAVLDTTPWPLALVYPARGVGLLREATTAEADALRTLGNLLGFSRARILLALDSPAGTTQLARSLDLTLGAVGDHLAVLRRAGLVSSSRTGRSVPYQRTTAGAALITATGSTT